MSKVSDIKTCPICGLKLDKPAILINFSSWLSVSCTNCGLFVISLLEFPDFNMERQDGLNLKKLAFYLKDNPLKADNDQEVISEKELIELEKKSKFPLSIRDSIDEIIRYLRYNKLENYNISQSNLFRFGIEDYSSLDLIINYAKNKRLLSFIQSLGTKTVYCSLDVNGIERSDELLRGFSNNSNVFVAMWFTDEMIPIYDNALKPAIEECGFISLRIDKKEHNNMIDDEMLEEIENCKFMVADFTGHRGGVYFEAGYAKALKKEVIFTCKSSDSKEVHFDTNHFNHIFWENEEDLKARLIIRIENSIKR